MTSTPRRRKSRVTTVVTAICAITLAGATWGGWMTPATAVSAPTSPSTVSDTPTASEIAEGLDEAGSRLLSTAPVETTTRASVSDIGGTKVTVPRDPSRAIQFESNEGREGISVGIPGDSENTRASVRDGISIFVNKSDSTATAVNPLSDGGAQLLVTIGSANSPTRYDFPVTVPEGAVLSLTENGGAQVAFDDGNLAATIPAPWAFDANERPVPTHFEMDGDSLVQVVNHSASTTTYPVLADPSVFSCDWHTSSCVKFTKAETKRISDYVSPGVVGAAVWAGQLCSKIPNGAVVLGCTSVVTVYAYLLSRSFDSAASSDRCIEIHFSRIAIGQTRWKAERC